MHGEDLHVLVVDDSAMVRQVMQAILSTNSRVKVNVAADPLIAWVKMQKEPPDVVITDLEMPRMTGYELMVQLRQSPTTRRIPVMVVTSRAGAKHRDRAMKEGATAFLTKPVQEDQLIAAVEQLMGSETRPTVPVG